MERDMFILSDEEVNEIMGNAFGMSDADIWKCYDELQEEVEKSKRQLPTIEWSRCPICGREEKYTSFVFGDHTGSMHCKYDCTKVGQNGSGYFDVTSQPVSTCLWDSIPPEDRMKPMGLSCPCPKCSPRC